jgi:hypothetical protein
VRRELTVAGLVAGLVCCLIAFSQDVGVDYGNVDCHIRDVYCDDAQPALDALIHGDLDGFFANQPLMGPVSLALRAPVAALAGFDDYDPLLVYRLGALACLLGLAAVALYLFAVMRSRRRPLWQAAPAAALLLANPMVFRALQIGHPEELLGAGLCVATAIALWTGRPLLAGLFLGGALATKLWAVLIVPAVLLAPRERRVAMRMAMAAGAVVLLLYAPMIAGDPGRFHGAVTSANKLGTVPGSVTPVNVWWFVASEKTAFVRHVAGRGNVLYTQSEVGYTLQKDVARITHPLVVVLAALLALLWARWVLPRRPETLLLLIALIFLLRCILDPGNSSYYHLPAVMALVAFEGLACRRLPWASAWLIGCLVATTKLSPHIHSDTGFGLLYLGWALPTAAGLALWLFRPGLLSGGSAGSARSRFGGAPAAGPSTGS